MDHVEFCLRGMLDQFGKIAQTRQALNSRDNHQTKERPMVERSHRLTMFYSDSMLPSVSIIAFQASQDSKYHYLYIE